jgi:hypothetical protein
MKTNQSGFAHLGIMAIAVVVVGVISFTAFRVGQSQINNRENSESNQPETVQEIKVAQEEEQQKEVVIPEEVKEVAAAPVEKQVEKIVEPTKTTDIKKKEDKTWLKMTKVSAVQSGGVLNVVSRLPQALTGTCNFKLWQDGYDKVYSSVSISNSSDCAGQLNVSGLQTYSGWKYYVWFDSSDGKVSASQPEEAIRLVQP